MLRPYIRSVSASLDRTVDLPDGRRLGYAEIGDPSGAPVIYCHGNPGSRLDFAAAPYDRALRAAGVRLIGTDRPGFGLSSPKPGRGHADWPADVAALADALDLDRFAVLGYSRGGRYALACAARLSGRLTAVGTLSAVGSPDMPGFHATYARLVRTEFLFARRLPGLWTKVTTSNVRRGTVRPSAVLLPFKIVLRCPADQAALESNRDGWAATIIEAARQGPTEWRREETDQPDALDFDLDEIRMPVTIWHGTADKLVPLAQARHLAQRLGDARLVELPDVGHLHTAERVASIAAELARAS